MISLVSLLVAVYVVGVVVALGVVRILDRRGSHLFRNWDDSPDMKTASHATILWPLWSVCIIVFAFWGMLVYLWMKFWKLILPAKK